MAPLPTVNLILSPEMGNCNTSYPWLPVSTYIGWL